MTPYLMPRSDWSAVLEKRGCEFVKDADGIESDAELWRSPGGHVFLVPYLVIADEDERRVADYSLKNIVAGLDGRAPRSGGNGTVGRTD